MRRELIFGLSGFIFIFVMIGFVDAACNESDGGVDYYTKGYVNLDGYIFWDECLGDTLSEQYCDPTNLSHQLTTINITCVNGCEDGACINQTINETCTESWQCTSWSTCINDTQTRTCTDSDNCSTTVNKPPTYQSCTIQGTNQTCTESWSCTLWSDCVNDIKTRTCTDSNNCNTTINKPGESQFCTTTNQTNETEFPKVCCHKFGYGNMMRKVNSIYRWIEESSCVTPEGFVGGGREIVDDEYCMNKTRKRIKFYADQSECPEACVCAGSTIKCQLEGGGREMTITAGKSGNIIIQVKGVSASTKVTLYKSEGEVYGVFKGNKTRVINMLPDQVRERIRERIRARLENQTIELDENGIYRIQGKKKARLFFLFPVREKMRIQIDSETGELIKVRNPWWGFLARDIEEEPIVGAGCGTVSPDSRNECCINKGYDLWNEETLECEFSD